MARLKNQKPSKNVLDLTAREPSKPDLPEMYRKYKDFLPYERILFDRDPMLQSPAFDRDWFKEALRNNKIFNDVLTKAYGADGLQQMKRGDFGPTELLFLRALEEQGQPGFLTPRGGMYPEDREVIRKPNFRKKGK